MKKTSLLLTTLLIIVSLVLPVAASESGYAPETTQEITAHSVYLLNLDDDMVIYERNSEDTMAPASLTKVMTAILAIEATDNLDSELVTYPQYVQDYLYTYRLEHGEISTGDLRAGDVLTMREYLYALMLPSANEAAMSIADHIGGSQEGFADLMNERAKELGATNTNFVNPNGLPDPDHYTTAKDMALITQHAITLPGFMEIVSETSYEASPQNRPDVTLTWNSTVLMQNKSYADYYYEPIRGIKTGTLPTAEPSPGRFFISMATKNNFNYLLVLMGSLYEPGGAQTAFQDAKALYEWVFSSFGYNTLIEEGEAEGELPVRLSTDADHVKLITAEDFSSLMPNSIEKSSVSHKIETDMESLDAPVEKGTPVGELVLLFEGQELGRVPLVTANSVEASSLLVFWEKFKEITKTFWFKFAVAFVVLLIVFYIVVMVIRNRNRKRRSRYGGYSGRRRR